jgi:hypothetical protein
MGTSSYFRKTSNKCLRRNLGELPTIVPAAQVYYPGCAFLVLLVFSLREDDRGGPKDGVNCGVVRGSREFIYLFS